MPALIFFAILTSPAKILISGQTLVKRNRKTPVPLNFFEPLFGTIFERKTDFCSVGHNLVVLDTHIKRFNLGDP